MAPDGGGGGRRSCGSPNPPPRGASWKKEEVEGQAGNGEEYLKCCRNCNAIFSVLEVVKDQKDDGTDQFPLEEEEAFRRWLSGIREQRGGRGGGYP